MIIALREKDQFGIFRVRRRKRAKGQARREARSDHPWHRPCNFVAMLSSRAVRERMRQCGRALMGYCVARVRKAEQRRNLPRPRFRSPRAAEGLSDHRARSALAERRAPSAIHQKPVLMTPQQDLGDARYLSSMVD